MLKRTKDFVRSIAPDESTFNQALALVEKSNNRKLVCGESSRAVWGAVKENGSTPYFAMVDLRDDVRSTCGCGSSGKPCIHALAVMMHPSTVPAYYLRDEPLEVAEWLDSRTDFRPLGTPVPLRDVAERDRHVLNMLDSLQKKLEDAFRLGLGSSAVRQERFWSEFETMLVDAHAQVLMHFIADACELLGSGELGQAKLASNLGRLALLLEAFRNVDSADEDYANEIRQAFGYSADEKDVVCGGERVDGVWLFLGRTLERTLDGPGYVAHSTFWNLETGRFAQYVQDFMMKDERNKALVDSFFKNLTTDKDYQDGDYYHGAMRYYPGTSRVQAVFESSLKLSFSPRRRPAGLTLDAFLQSVPSVLSRAPWVQTIPAYLDDVVARPFLRLKGGKRVREWFLVSRSGASAPFVVPSGSEAEYERYFSETCNSSASVFAKWNGREFGLVNIWNGERLVTCDRNDADCQGL